MWDNFDPVEGISRLSVAFTKEDSRNRFGKHCCLPARKSSVLTFIRRCRDFGFTQAQIRDLTRLARDDQRSGTEARDLAQAHLVEVRRKMTELQELQRGSGQALG